jgi:excisionase family DNA binding protein
MTNQTIITTLITQLMAQLLVPGEKARRGTLGANADEMQHSPSPALTLADRIEQIGRALTAKELAALLNVSKITVFKLAKARRIPSFHIGTCVRFDSKKIANWLRTQ